MKNNYLFLGGGALLFLGVAAFLFFPAAPIPSSPDSSSSRNITVPAPEPVTSPVVPPPAASAKTTITEEDTDIVTVRYRATDGFSPKQITITSAGLRACIFRVINESNTPLTIRLSPHRPQDDWGSPYPPIPSHGESLIDPRYRLDRIAFHNHEKPAEELRVSLEEACKLE